ncbi:3-keto-5-aminohexanoate cleavage protein [Rhodoferax sp. UBA5149]|uniref:3-keto-5-aminohexanoate cleavage protein n=1 Tax=Rhodoferax sp. UBA5149 TaxID=1947379 RepID=UPI0025F09A40|nr:3-keto-5-aminohexanoate cleavage protein [Rhodoferax sp. UBA5149]
MVRKVIVTCAVTGAIHTPSMSPYLPITEKEIADAAVEAAQAGASIIHLHARDPKTGRPDQSPERFAPILSSISERSDAVLNITTGGSPSMTLDERLQPALIYAPEVASLNMGSMNFGAFQGVERIQNYKHDWERAHLEGTRSGVFRNTFSDIEGILRRCGDQGTRFEYECYDVGHLYTLAHFLDRQLAKPPLFIQTIFGVLGGIGNHPEDVINMRRTADRLFGNDYVWSVLGVGRAQLPIASMAIAAGGNLRVGLEDSLWLRPGQMAKSSAEQVIAACTVIGALGLEVASPTQAREMLGLNSQNRITPSRVAQALS